MERIFVQIASYRDPELQPTLEDLFDKAEFPDRLTVGSCLQWIHETDRVCDFNVARAHQVRCLRVHANESRGVCWARHEIQKLWSGEEYTLQIDSHMRFEKHWDSKAIACLKRCPSGKALLSAYPPQYQPPCNLSRGFVSAIIPTYFDERHTLCLQSAEIPIEKAPGGPIPGAFCGACFIFAPSAIIAEVPYDPDLYFLGEEISMSVRLWTHGWDIFHPNVPLLYHAWKRYDRPLHWNDNQIAKALDAKSRKRVNHILGIEPASGDSIIELEKYGLGTARTLEEYEQFSGIDFAARSVVSYRLLPKIEDGEFKVIQPFFW